MRGCQVRLVDDQKICFVNTCLTQVSDRSPLGYLFINLEERAIFEKKNLVKPDLQTGRITVMPLLCMAFCIYSEPGLEAFCA